MRLVPFAAVVAAALAFGPVVPGSASIRAQSPLTERMTAFVNVSVIPMDYERVLVGQTVLVRGGRIIALGSVKNIAVPDDAVRVDGTGKFLIPGLGDMHVHLRYEPASIADVLFAFLANGVTVVRDMHAGGRVGAGAEVGDQTRGLDLRRRITAGEVLGPRLYTAGDPDTRSPEAAARSVAALKEDGHDFVKVSLDPGLDSSNVVMYDSIVAAAQRVGLRVVGHVPPSVGVEQVLADHWASTEHLYEYPEYLFGVNRRWSINGGQLMSAPGALIDTAQWMRFDYRIPAAKLRHLAVAQRKAGVWSCPTLAVQEYPLRSSTGSSSASPTFRVLARYLKVEREVIRALHKAGAGLLLGTDVGYFDAVAGFSVHQELAALVQAGLTPYQALETGTRNVAAFLNALDSTGTVAVGKRADLVLLYGNPLQDIGYTAGPAGVMVGGHWLPRAAIDAQLDTILAGAGTMDIGDVHRQLATMRSRIWRH